MIPVFLLSRCQPAEHKIPEGFDLQGHRGAMGLKPENTLPSFFKAVDLGVRTIEFDLAVTAEHLLVISHEPWFRAGLCLQPDGSPIPVNRERSFRLYERSYEEIAQFDCGSLPHPAHPGQRNLFAEKPLMLDAIVAIDEYAYARGRTPVRYSIEIKSNPAWDGFFTPEPDVFARLLYEELQILETEHGIPVFERISVQSFDPRPLRVFRTLAPDVPIAALTSATGSVDDQMAPFGFIPEIYSPNFGLLTRQHADRAKELGMRIIPWTVNEKEDMKAMVELGVDGIITDYPGRFLELYSNR